MALWEQLRRGGRKKEETEQAGEREGDLIRGSGSRQYETPCALICLAFPSVLSLLKPCTYQTGARKSFCPPLASVTTEWRAPVGRSVGWLCCLWLACSHSLSQALSNAFPLLSFQQTPSNRRLCGI